MRYFSSPINNLKVIDSLKDLADLIKEITHFIDYGIEIEHFDPLKELVGEEENSEYSEHFYTLKEAKPALLQLDFPLLVLVKSPDYDYGSMTWFVVKSNRNKERIVNQMIETLKRLKKDSF